MSRLALPTPLGEITLVAEGDALVAIAWCRASHASTGADAAGDATAMPLLRRAAAQLSNYLAGRRRTFDLPLSPSGTPFQRRVWARLAEIPYGATISYGDLARDLGSQPRAVAQACARNPLPIVSPCHRVVGRNGALTGYSGGDGIASKRALLALERHAGLPAAGPADAVSDAAVA
jgi:methylated-DNA-[protein]-cysteine S-methyltransferase